MGKKQRGRHACFDFLCAFTFQDEGKNQTLFPNSEPMVTIVTMCLLTTFHAGPYRLAGKISLLETHLSRLDVNSQSSLIDEMFPVALVVSVC